MSTPSISVIIPAYNVENYITECLDSVFSQQYLPHEVIIIDDGSVDQTKQRIEVYQERQPLIRLLTQKNSGQGVARNRALEHATGDYVLFLDADDSIEAGLFSTFQAVKSNRTIDIFHFNWRRFEHKNKGWEYTVIDDDLITQTPELNDTDCDRMLQITNYFSANNIFRRQFLIENDIRYGEGSLYEDNIFMVRAITTANRIANTPKAYYNYRHHVSQSTKYNNNDAKHYHAFVAATRLILAQCQPRTKYTQYYLLRYCVSKFMVYTETRVPRRYHQAFARDFVDVFKTVVVSPDPLLRDSFLKLCLRLDVFSNNRYQLFLQLVLIKIRYAKLRRRVEKVVK